MNNTMKRLSIIVPMYNSKAYLPKCIGSLLHQDIPFDDYEIILVNDGSPDGSKNVAEDYASRFSNITVLSQENKGTSGARNTGIRHACGKYVYFVDPDDYILENSLRCVLDQMDAESLDVLRFAYTEVDENYQPTKSCKHPEMPDYSPEIMDGCTFMAQRLGVACYVWTYIFRTSIIVDNGIFFIEGDYFDDTPWLPKVMRKARRVNSLDIKRHFYLIRSNSLVQAVNEKAIQKKISGEQFLIEELGKQKKECNNANAAKWYDMMIAHCVVTLLNLVSLYRYGYRDHFINEIKSRRILPLSLNRATRENKAKMLFISVAPYLYCWIMHKRHSLS